jgi:hypothetical protein
MNHHNTRDKLPLTRYNPHSDAGSVQQTLYGVRPRRSCYPWPLGALRIKSSTLSTMKPTPETTAPSNFTIRDMAARDVARCIWVRTRTREMCWTLEALTKVGVTEAADAVMYP